jgi:hypothetical protein
MVCPEWITAALNGKSELVRRNFMSEIYPVPNASSTSTKPLRAKASSPMDSGTHSLKKAFRTLPVSGSVDEF